MTRKKLPIGIQTFSEIRTEGYYYADKTDFCYKLAMQGKYYFLSRPRRFGKSLLIDTLGELFAGNQTLFEGLSIHDKWDWSVKYPVLRISFGGGVVKTIEDLNDNIQDLLEVNQKALNIDCGERSHKNCFAQLIRAAHEKTGQRVVILVDEYDKPILDNLHKPEIAKEIRDGLRNLYSVIKDSDAHVKFAMLTGVSKFSKVSLFSGLNNLRDITISRDYSAICGYTDEDIDTVFAPEIGELDREKIRHWYNGYNWTGTSVYNPFDVLLLFEERLFKAHWFETGSATFLIDLLAQRGFFTPNLTNTQTSLELLSAFDVEKISNEALLFQTGYLTISRVEEPLPNLWIYVLGYPNHEVETSLNNALLGALGLDEQQALLNRLQLIPILKNNDFAQMQNLFTAFFASIPNDWYRNNPIAQYEGYYASIFYSYFASLGLEIILEDVTNFGRIDMTVKFNDNVYLFEFKVVELVPNGKALQQLIDKNYAQKYQALNQPIHLIGVEFSKEARSVVGFEFLTILMKIDPI
ncbi:MAG: ATP-binding protein [Methylobacter sp.]|nr:ATP-binding protein [Methylobacter sp.]MDP2098204.1 ATP-binding protein [Methylobacter sp.]MDP2429929.1 ATP-binding protein [Methylobacter sp.]MDP3056091.1 ATP-binding protein [Methylobacter sp.]MDP3362858.1 ATP-binding protein [Methylobacter sp.]